MEKNPMKIEDITELAEAVQAYRKGKFADRNEYEKLVKERGCTEDTAFLLSVKDTFEDEMADACIRLMDLTGRFDVELPTDIKIIRTEGEDITVTLFKAIFFMQNAMYRDAGELVMYFIRLSEAIGIDIEWHIRLKMAYNVSRPYLHGNKF